MASGEQKKINISPPGWVPDAESRGSLRKLHGWQPKELLLLQMLPN